MDNLERNIFQALEKLTAALKSQLWEVAQNHCLSPIMTQFFLYIWRHPARLCTISNLAQEFSLTKATVCDAVISLEKRGYIRKEPGEKDGRIKFLRLTEKGRQLTREVESYERWLVTCLLYTSDAADE